MRDACEMPAGGWVPARSGSVRGTTPLSPIPAANLHPSPPAPLLRPTAQPSALPSRASGWWCSTATHPSHRPYPCSSAHAWCWARTARGCRTSCLPRQAPQVGWGGGRQGWQAGQGRGRLRQRELTRCSPLRLPLFPGCPLPLTFPSLRLHHRPSTSPPSFPPPTPPPPTAAVVEFLFVADPPLMFWHTAAALGQQYWLLPVPQAYWMGEEMQVGGGRGGGSGLGCGAPARVLAPCAEDAGANRGNPTQLRGSFAAPCGPLVGSLPCPAPSHHLLSALCSTRWTPAPLQVPADEVLDILSAALLPASGADGGAQAAPTCAPGSYATLYGEPRALRCTACSPGTYSYVAGAPACKPCAAGRYAAGIGASACRTCQPGTYSAPDGSACLDCPAGGCWAVSGGSAGGASLPVVGRVWSAVCARHPLVVHSPLAPAFTWHLSYAPTPPCQARGACCLARGPPSSA